MASLTELKLLYTVNFRVLKYKFLERQCNRRLDYTCGVLIHKVSSYYTHSYNETVNSFIIYTYLNQFIFRS